MPTYTDALTDTYFEDTYTDTVHELPHVDDAMQWHFFSDILIIVDFAMCFHICIALTYWHVLKPIGQYDQTGWHMYVHIQ